MKKVLTALLMASCVFGNEINLDLTNNTLMLNGAVTIPDQNIAIRGGYLYNDLKNTHNYYTIGIQAQGLNELDDYDSKLAIFIDFDHTKNNSAIPIGIGIYNNQFGNLKYPLFAKAEIAYAPAVLSFDDANRLFKAKIEIGLKPIENAKVYIGYRNISFDSNYQSVGYVGVGFIF